MDILLQTNIQKQLHISFLISTSTVGMSTIYFALLDPPRCLLQAHPTLKFAIQQTETPVRSYLSGHASKGPARLSNQANRDGGVPETNLPDPIAAE